MKKFIFFLFLINTTLYAQNKDTISYSKYLEDQIYIGFSYITMRNLPETVSKNGISNSFVIGFIKDLPLNKQGNFGFGIGLGYGRNTYFQDIKITRPNGKTLFETIEGSFKNNRFSTHALEIPFELRWRTSTIDKYKFYRIYAGGKVSYAFVTKSRFKTDDNTIKVKGIDEINKLQYGLTLSVGFGTWNFNVYYGLNDIFSDAKFNNLTPIEMRDFRVGLMFYIL
ncbi:MAG TPA: hypothetical protein DDZ39_09200 [Flavobacteriaceae bacterium]|jgi:hypothetical protein|nr:hypothetical protein [Flavobacteriaceae bacterium]HBS12168.1 hypothetical protein [Flavobacteriaceae bacterium]